MRINTFIAIGVVFAVVGLLGLTYIFPKVMCISGQDFVDQIDTSSGLEKYSDYSLGDTVTISDSIARMELSDGQTLVWLETIGKSESDPPFRFGSNIMGDFGVGNSITIKFEVVQDSTGDFTLKGYENGGSGLSSDTISSRYSTVNEYVFMILILGGVCSIFYGGYKSFIGKDDEPQDDWGFPAQAPPQPPMAAPPMAAPPVQQPISPVAPPSSAAAPSMAAPPMPSSIPTPMAPEPTSMTITVPPGVVSGQVLTVTLPDGRSVNVQVPAGCNAGSQFTITVN